MADNILQIQYIQIFMNDQKRAHTAAFIIVHGDYFLINFDTAVSRKKSINHSCLNFCHPGAPQPFQLHLYLQTADPVILLTEQ